MVQNNTYVYVLASDGTPLMPTTRCGKVRRLLRDGLARVVRRTPFVIQLNYETSTKEVDELTLGVDAGYKHVGFSVTSQSREYYAVDHKLRTDIQKKLSSRAVLRRSRRSRKTRYRKARFLNRKSSKSKGWLAPSVRQKINDHINQIARIHRFLPISKIIVETAQFDTRLLSEPDVVDYQTGLRSGFLNLREAILHRDGHKCQLCKGKSGDSKLHVHHIESRQTGGNSPANLITLCVTCHKSLHAEGLESTLKRKVKPLRAASFMNIMRPSLEQELRSLYGDQVSFTQGWMTKASRQAINLEKSHINDAYAIAGNLRADRASNNHYLSEKRRCHNRQLHKMTIRKGGVRSAAQANRIVNGYQNFDLVRYQGKCWFIKGRRTSGYFSLRCLSGNVIGSCSYKKLHRLGIGGYTLTERIAG